MTFKQLDLIAPILSALEEVGYTQPTPIQEQSIPQVLQLRDLMACAQTGTGKTAAFALPIVQLLQIRKEGQQLKGKRPIKALIITPTRELAIQIAEQIELFARHTKIRQTVIFGGVGAQPQIQTLRNGVDILIATPGRLLDLQQQGHVDLSQLEIFVLDEADRMLDMGFIHDVRKILKIIPKQRQSLFFSATMPDNIIELANSILTNPVRVEVTPVSSTAETIQQRLYFVDKDKKRELLLYLIFKELEGRVLVFSRTKYGADKLARFLHQNGIKSAAIHGDKSQQARQKALSQFKESKIQVLVATDIAARGIDIEELECVVNFEVPNIAETYVHRIGRSGRAGAAGLAISLCDDTERPYIKDIQKLIGLEIPTVEKHPFPTQEPAHSELISIKKQAPKQVQQKPELKKTEPRKEGSEQKQGGYKGKNRKFYHKKSKSA